MSYCQLSSNYIQGSSDRGRDVRLDLQLPVQSVPITTKVVSSNPAHSIHF